MDLYKYEYLETDSEGEVIENEEIEQNSDQIATPVLEDIYDIDKKIQDDLDLIALVEGNPRLYAKGKTGYKNIQEKEMAWVSIGKALKHPLSGSEAKHRWDTLRNLYGRARREILALTKQQERSGSGRDNVSYENLLTPQSMAIHRFMDRLYVPRRTFSNYNQLMPSTSSPSSFDSPKKKSRLLPRPHSKSLVIKRPRLSISDSEESTTSLKDSSGDSSACKENFAGNIFTRNKSIGDQANDCSFIVPTSDIKKGKKTNLEIDSMIKESSKTIAAACSVLPTIMNATSKADTEEDKNLILFLSHGLKRVPEQQKIRCVIKLLEVLESFQKD